MVSLTHLAVLADDFNSISTGPAPPVIFFQVCSGAFGKVGEQKINNKARLLTRRICCKFFILRFYLNNRP